MIYIKRNTQKDRFEISFFIKNDIIFNNILSYLKSKRFKYKKENRVWTESNVKIYNIIDELEELDDLVISPIDYQYLCDHRLQKETIKKRRKINDSLFTYPCLKGKDGLYKNYQYEDIHKMICTNRIINASEQRLGKMYEEVCVISQLYDTKDITKILYLTPGEGVLNAKREILKFSSLFKDEEIGIISAEENRQPFQDDIKIVIGTYAGFRLVCDDAYTEFEKTSAVGKKYYKSNPYLKEWCKENKVLLVCDEAHYLAIDKLNRQVRILKNNINFFEYRHWLGGTIDKGKVEKLYWVLKLLDPSIIQYDKRQEFLESICNTEIKTTKKGKEYPITTSYKMFEKNKFLKSIQPWIIRRLRKDCLDLPPIYKKPVYIKLNSNQDRIYKLLCIDELKKMDGAVNTKDILNRFPYISKALYDPTILKEDIFDNEELNTLVKKFKFKDNSKFNELDQIITRVCKDNDEKLLIWSYHPKVIDELAKVYKKYDPLVIHGNTKIKGLTKNEIKDNIVETFKSEKKHKILIANPTVLNVAISLAGYVYDVVYWDYIDFVTYSQSGDRITGQDQKKDVVIHNFICQDTIEERTWRSIQTGADVNKEIYDKEYLNKSQCKNLFLGREKI